MGDRRGASWTALGAHWLRVAIRGEVRRSGRWTLLATNVLAILCATVLREVVRLSGLDLAELVPAHERAATKGGLPAFLAFAAINGGLIAWIVAIVRRALVAPARSRP